MNIEKIKEFINIRQDLRDSGVIGLDVWENKVHLTVSEMVKLPNLKLDPFDDDYPYEATSVIDGIKFYCLINDDRLEKYPQLKDLIPMVEDVDLSGMPEVHESA